MQCWFVLVTWSIVLIFGISRPGVAMNVVDKLISFHAQQLFDQAGKLEFNLNIGRKSLIQQMQKEPEQLAKDLPRIPTIMIGAKTITTLELRGRSPEQQYILVAHELEMYVKKNVPILKFSSSPGRIGAFYTVEAIYGIVQSLSAPAQIGAYENEIILTDGNWGPAFNEGKTTAAFAITDPLQKILDVVVTHEKNLVQINDPTKRKLFVTQNRTRFYLDSGEVSFIYAYDLHTKHRSWIRKTLL